MALRGATYNPVPMSLAVSLQYLLPKQALTRLAGLFAASRGGAITQWAIRRFVRRYRVNMAEAAQPDPTAYATFNDFFTRALKPGARPLADAARFVLSPADGAVGPATLRSRPSSNSPIQPAGRSPRAAQRTGSRDNPDLGFRDLNGRYC